MQASQQKIKNKKNEGFTIIELLIATVVFSIVLLVFLTAFLQTSRLFYKGVNMNNTQESARNVVQDISDDLQFSLSPPPNFTAAVHAPGSGIFCIGLHRYRYKLGYQLGSTTGPGDYGISRDTINVASGCPDTATVPVNTATNDELLDNGMQLNYLSLNCQIGRCTINVHIIFYGGTPNDLFASANYNTPGQYNTDQWNAPDAQCTGDLNSSQYCAVADYNSTVIQRS